MRHTFRGKRYAIKFKSLRKVKGWCYYESPRKIEISSDLKGQSLLDTLIHESMHACLPDLDEDAIEASASDIARLLWRLGYRRICDQ